MDSRMNAIELPGDEIRTMLRESLRGFLRQSWPPDAAATKSGSPSEISAIWNRLVSQGVASLGSDFGEGGLHEICVVMDEMGRASCPAPM